MSIQAPSSSKEVHSVSTRVKNTKKEIELLKAELDKLIDTGKQFNPVQTLEEKPDPPKPKTDPQPPTIAKKTTYIPPKKVEPQKASPPKKTRTYNVAETREYIKKQKEKRAEQLKAQINVADNKLDLKKQKLKELHQKTLELVSKNVQLKRERSKSRERGVPIRLDKANSTQKPQERLLKPTENPRAKSLDRLGKGTQEIVNKPHQKVPSKSQDRQKAKSSERTANSSPRSEIPGSNKGENSNRISRSRTRKFDVKDAIDPNYLYPPNAKLLTSKNDINLEKTLLPPTCNVPAVDSSNLLHPPKLKYSTKIDGGDINLERTIFPPFQNGADRINMAAETTDSNNLLHSPKSIFSLVNLQKKQDDDHMAEPCRKDSKETQTTSNKVEEPVWLQPQPVLPYPYNFINTVKRKLQHAISSPRNNCVDVGVQNSEMNTPEPERVKSREEIKEILIKSTSDLKSFASHKCPNLDLKAVENLELVPNNSSKRQVIDKVAKNLFEEYESESDTSKNIPEISSESLSTPQKYKKSEPKLNLQKLKDLKLQPHKLASPALSTSSSIKTDTNGYPEWQKGSYSSDFLKESESNKSGTKSGSSTTKTITKERSNNLLQVPSTSTIRSRKDTHKISTPTRKSSTTSTVSTDSISSKKLVPEVEVTSSFKSLLTEGQISKSTTELSEPTSFNKVSSLSLKEPTVSLSYKKDNNNLELAKSKMKNITIRPAASSNSNVNEIHLKFEAEVRLLNDFNESLKQFMDVEKAFENLKNTKESNISMRKILHNVDTQTSVVTKTSTNVTTADKSFSASRNHSINYSRGSEVDEELNDTAFNNSFLNKSVQNSTFSTDWGLSNLNASSNTNISTEEEDKLKFSVSNVENYNNLKNCAGLSLNVFDQLIKDEDARIQHLKAIIKIREQALLDRTKGELVWLNIQKKQLIQTGKIEEASLLKKKQRGIILKHEQELNEIKKLKHIQKAASEERKNILRQQRNLIKTQLSTENMLSKIKVKTPRERRSSAGPLRVVQSRSDSFHSETSYSRRSSEEVLSVTSHSRSSVKLSEAESEKEPEDVPVSKAKRTLFMREAALQRRRKEAEELLRWHQKLLDKERKVQELEAAASAVIERSQPARDRRDLRGGQLNRLWTKMTGRDDGEFVEAEVYAMSQSTLERFCRSAGRKKQRNGEQERPEEAHYSSTFDAESVQEERTKISSITELIDDFSRIEDEISLISRRSEKDITSLKEEEVGGSEAESSAVQTVADHVVGEEIPEVIEEEEVVGSSPKVTEDLEESVHESRVEEAVTEEIVSEKITEEKESISEKITEEEEEIISEKITEREIAAEEKEVGKVSEKEEESTAEEITTEAKDTKRVSSDVSEGPLEETVEEIVNADSAPTADSITSSVDLVKESLELEEALECASKIEESLTKLNEKLASEKKDEIAEVSENKEVSEEIQSEELSTSKEIQSEISSKTSEVSEKPSPKKTSNQIDVKKRVSEILADANAPRGDKSPRLQDLYVTAYDVGSSTAELIEDGRPLPTNIFGSEAEELWRKQLAIEQEIKQLEQQQKEQLPYVFMREIPNKPPPPYTPPSTQSSLPQSIVPLNVKQINEISDYSSKVLYKAYLNDNLDKVKFSENGFKLFSKVEVTRTCAEFIFNICRDIAKDHYRQFEKVEEPSWLMLAKKSQLSKTKPPDASGLDKLMNRKLKELFGFKKVQVIESAVVKWGRKKRDHVDEILVIESQEEESQWTNFDKDELIVKDQITEEIMKMLIDETGNVFSKIFARRKIVVG